MGSQQSANVTVKLTGDNSEVQHDAEELVSLIHSLIIEKGFKTAHAVVFVTLDKNYEDTATLDEISWRTDTQ